VCWQRNPASLNLIVRRHRVTFRCATCGETHEGLPDLGYRWPDPYFDVPEAERPLRIMGTSNTCSIDDRDFFIRGVILIPIKGQTDHLAIGVWVSQKRENYQKYLDNFDTTDIGPFFGWLSNSISFYKPDTWALKTMAHFQGSNQRPLIKLEAMDHPLCRDYSEGITLDRAWSIVHFKG
jgi:hypothetical protein